MRHLSQAHYKDELTVIYTYICTCTRIMCLYYYMLEQRASIKECAANYEIKKTNRTPIDCRVGTHFVSNLIIFFHLNIVSNQCLYWVIIFANKFIFCSGLLKKSNILLQQAEEFGGFSMQTYIGALRRPLLENDWNKLYELLPHRNLSGQRLHFKRDGPRAGTYVYF